MEIYDLIFFHLDKMPPRDLPSGAPCRTAWRLPGPRKNARQVINPYLSSVPSSSMGRTVYLPVHEWLIFMVNVGKYTIHGLFGVGFLEKKG